MERHGCPTSVDECERGAVLVETSFTAIVFFMIIFMGCELLRLGYNVMATNYVASRFLREAVIGNLDPLDYGKVEAGDIRGNQLEDKIIDYAAQLGLFLGPKDGNNPNVTVCDVGLNCSGGDNAGTADNLIYVRINYTLPMFFGLGSYQVNTIYLAKNEPFNAF